MHPVLIVDDEEEIGDFLSEILKDIGLDTHAVLSGEEAIELIGAKDWKLAFVDLRLSTEINGLELIKIIKEKQPAMFVIAMTGYVDLDLKHKAEKLGISGFLEKPDDLKTAIIISKVKELLKIA